MLWKQEEDAKLSLLGSARSIVAAWQKAVDFSRTFKTSVLITEDASDCIGAEELMWISSRRL